MRARNIKPGFFTNDELAELSPLTRLLFVGMWCMADREGRMKDRPKKIKVEILPFDDCDIETELSCLHSSGFITRYEVDGNKYIQINKFAKHQSPHIKEAPSEIPALTDKHHTGIILAPNQHEASPPDCGLLIEDSGLMIDDTHLHDLPKPTRMGEFEFQLLYQKSFGTTMPGGCKNLAIEIRNKFTFEAITQAFETASVYGAKNMAYVHAVLKGTSNKKDDIEDFDLNKNYEPGTYFYDLKQSMQA